VPFSRNLGTLTSWNPLGHSRPVVGLIYSLSFSLEWNDPQKHAECIAIFPLQQWLCERAAMLHPTYLALWCYKFQ